MHPKLQLQNHTSTCRNFEQLERGRDRPTDSFISFVIRRYRGDFGWPGEDLAPIPDPAAEKRDRDTSGIISQARRIKNHGRQSRKVNRRIIPPLITIAQRG